MKQLGKILDRLDSIEKNICELQTARPGTHECNQNIVSIIGTVEPAELNRLGLPVSNQIELKLLNSRLEDAEFFEDMVRFA